MSNDQPPAPAMTFAEAVVACSVFAQSWWDDSASVSWDCAIARAQTIVRGKTENSSCPGRDCPESIRSALAQGQGAALPDMAVLEAYSDQRTTDLRAKVAELERDLADMRERKNMHKKQEYAYMDDYFREKSRADKAERELANGAPELWQERNNLEQDRDALLAKCERLERETAPKDIERSDLSDCHCGNRGTVSFTRWIECDNTPIFVAVCAACGIAHAENVEDIAVDRWNAQARWLGKYAQRDIAALQSAPKPAPFTASGGPETGTFSVAPKREQGMGERPEYLDTTWLDHDVDDPMTEGMRAAAESERLYALAQEARVKELGRNAGDRLVGLNRRIVEAERERDKLRAEVERLGAMFEVGPLTALIDRYRLGSVLGSVTVHEAVRSWLAARQQGGAKLPAGGAFKYHPPA